MKKTVQLEGQSIEVNASMGWLFVYRNEFGHDILPDIMPMIDAFVTMGAEIYADMKEGDSVLNHITPEMLAEAVYKLSTMEVVMLVNILWAMAKNADNGIEGPQTWVNKFDVFPIEEVTFSIVELILESSTSSKNSKSLLEKIRKIKSSTLQHLSQPEYPEDLTPAH